MFEYVSLYCDDQMVSKQGGCHGESKNSDVSISSIEFSIHMSKGEPSDKTKRTLFAGLKLLASLIVPERNGGILVTRVMQTRIL